MNRRIWIIGMTLVLLLAVAMMSGCGKVREATRVARTVAEMAKTGEEMAESISEDGIDWENIELTEDDVRLFYSGVRKLNDKYPDIEFESAIVATLQSMGEGINIQKEVEKETDMSFEQYTGLSNAILLTQAELAGLIFTTEMVASMEEGLAQFDEMDQSTLTEEQIAVMEEQRQALSEAKAEMETLEFQNGMMNAEMILALREEMGF